VCANDLAGTSALSVNSGVRHRQTVYTPLQDLDNAFMSLTYTVPLGFTMSSDSPGVNLLSSWSHVPESQHWDSRSCIWAFRRVPAS
jgi:hypothetical protein